MNAHETARHALSLVSGDFSSQNLKTGSLTPIDPRQSLESTHSNPGPTTMIITYKDATNITYESAHTFATIFFDGFRDDLFFRTFHPDLFGELAGPQRILILRRVARSWARNCMLEILKGTQVLCIAADGDKPVAAAIFELPKHQLVELTITQKLWRALYFCWAKIMDLVEGSPRSMIHDRDYEDFLAEMKLCGPTESQSRFELANMTPNEVADFPYPRGSTLYLEVLAVCMCEQKKGYGSLLVRESLEHFVKREQFTVGPTFTEGIHHCKGPAKVSVHPSVGKEDFYKKFGFKTVDSRAAMIGDQKILHKFMQKVL